MQVRRAELSPIELPSFGLPQQEPVLSADIYRKRLEGFAERAREMNLDTFIIYGDREHSANVSYLTGYDPRFEEAALIIPLAADSSPRLLVGNEGYGFAGISPIRKDLEVELYQSFSLLGQDRSKSRSLSEILRESGVVSGSRVGTAGWKHFSPGEMDKPETTLEIPSYIADTLRELAGDPTKVINANSLLMDSKGGMRTVNEVEQLACFEFSATHASQSVRNVLFGLRAGMSEYEAVQLMDLKGFPLSCHLMLSAGERAFLGMGSPSSRRIQPGDPFTTAIGLWGNLTCRAGFAAESAADLPAGIRDYVDKLVRPYFEAVVAWYEAVGIGVTGGELYRIIHERIGDPFFGVGLNPGHLIHLDEWVDSPIYDGSIEKLRSGMAIQVDVIPATGTPYFTTNIEEGIALADEKTREDLARRYPEAWNRIEGRREFMREILGIRIKPEVLPFSNLPGYLPPFVFAPGTALRMSR